MTDILCRWLNQELRLSKAVEPKSFAKDFSSGYLIGEVLHKYHLQSDFTMFMRRDTSISKLNNFTRLEPTLQLLGIPFDINTVQELMQGKQGVAAQLLCQLYVSLEKKKRADITGTTLEILQPAANAGLHKKERDIYSVLRGYRQKHIVMIPHNSAAVNQVPKPPPCPSQLNLKTKRQQQQHKQQAQKVQAEIAQFETSRKKLVTSAFGSSSSGQPVTGALPMSGSSFGTEVNESGDKLTLKSNSQYTQEIRQRLKDDAVSRQQRQKRRDRFLVEQLKAHEAQEEERREEQLVKHLTRQTQHEQRLATQLLQIRAQKEVIRQNRLFREQQYQQRRERDFQEALDREAALAQQAKLDRAEEIKKELENLNRIAAERAQCRYKKHYRVCKDILEQIVDLATKTGEYRLLTGNRIPQKLTREWKELLFSGLPLYEPDMGQLPGFPFLTSLDPVELEKQEMLNNLDYDEYTNMVGEWVWPQEAEEAESPPSNNSILGHVVLRLKNIVHPPIVTAPSSTFPHFTLKACVLGKFCSGKTTCLTKIAAAHGICVLSPETLIVEAVKAYHCEKQVKEQQGEKDEPLPFASSSVKSGPDTQALTLSQDSNERLSSRAMLGAAAEKLMTKGKTLPTDLLVDIIVEAIKQLPAESGWILDGFPGDITQAHLLEEALDGVVDVGTGTENNRANLAIDPNAPKPPPPPKPVLDLALLLDICDEAVTTRAFTHTDKNLTADKNVHLAKIPHRIAAFHDAWPKLEKWFEEKQNILFRVDANVVKEELYEKVESILQQTMMQRQEAATTSFVDEALENGNVPESSLKGTPVPVDVPPPLPDEASDLTESALSPHKEKTQSVNSPHEESGTDSPKESSRKPSTSSVTKEESPEVPKIPPETATLCPGSLSWVYVSEPLPLEISEYLCAQWETACDSYVNNIKAVMQQLRPQNIVLNHLLFNLREEFQHYLKRPDVLQELVSQWQKDFNSISDDMREDEETKAELHMRLNELRERLWDMADKRKERDEQERASLLCSGWLEDHTAVLINHHSTLIEVELNRFQETLCILKLYYVNMCKELGPEPSSELVCMPLLGNQEDKDQDNSAESEDTSAGVQLDGEKEKRITQLIPFLSKRPDLSEGACKTKGTAQTQLAKPSDEKLIADYEEALRAIIRLMAAQVHKRETKLPKEKPQEIEKPSASASKGVKSKTSGKKSKGPPPTPPSPSPAPVEEKESEEPLDHFVLLDKIVKEYAAALEHEGNGAKARITQVKGHGLATLQMIQNRADEVFSQMEKWSEAFYLSTMKSIEQLVEVVRHHIEAGAKLKNELVLENTEFHLNGDCHMATSPPPPPPPPPVEEATLSPPTVKQLESLHHQLCSNAPSGLLSKLEFFSLLSDITSVDLGISPETWINVNEKQMMEIVKVFLDKFDVIDLRRFLLSVALPWPFPSVPQLLAVRKRFKEADTDNTGYVNREQYLQTELWFSTDSDESVPEDTSEPLPCDRLVDLHKFFFQLFADHSSCPPRLDYMLMLQYFAADPNPQLGFIRALSVELGQWVGEHSSLSHIVKSVPTIKEATELEAPEPESKCSSPLADPDVSIPAVLSVVCHKLTKMKDVKLPPGCLREEQLVQLLIEHGFTSDGCVRFSTLSKSLLDRLMNTSTHHKLVNIHEVLLAQRSEEEQGSTSG